MLKNCKAKLVILNQPKMTLKAELMILNHVTNRSVYMKSFLIVFKKSLPLGIGIVLALISIAFTVKITERGRVEDNVIAAIFFGVIGFPMLIAGALKLIKELNME